MAVHAADLGDTVKLPDLAGQVEAGGSRGYDLVALGGEARVGPHALVDCASLHLRLRALAPPLLLLIIGAASAEEDSLETFDPGDFPPNSRFLPLKDLPLWDLATLSSTNSLAHLWSVGGAIVETGLVVDVVVVFVGVVVAGYLTVVVKIDFIDIVVVVEVQDGGGVGGGRAGIGEPRGGSHIVRQRLTGGTCVRDDVKKTLKMVVMMRRIMRMLRMMTMSTRMPTIATCRRWFC